MSGEHVAAPLARMLQPHQYDAVAKWLRDVASEHALDTGAKVLSPSVSWLAEAVTFYEYPEEGL